MPPLSERREDIPLLVRHLVQRAADKGPDVAGRFVKRQSGWADVCVDARLIDELLRRDYPANLRELDAVLWAAVAASEGDTIACGPNPTSVSSTVKSELRTASCSMKRRIWRAPWP